MKQHTPAPYRVFVVDDHAIMREVLVTYLNRQPDLEVTGTAASGVDALTHLASTPCDLVLVDVAMPGMNGIELVHHLSRLHPDLRCLMLSGHAEQFYVKDALDAGASGYVMKGDPALILQAIQEVQDGGTYLSEQVSRML